MMQFTTMSGMKTPNVAYNAGTKDCMSICTMVTNDAITTMKAGMRTLSGMKFLMSEMTMFDKISTAIVATPMPNPLAALVVVPSVGHMPSTSTKVGFSLTIPLRISCSLFIVSSFLSVIARLCGRTRSRIGRGRSIAARRRSP